MRNDLAQLYMASGDVKKRQPRLEAQVKNGQASPQMLAALASVYLGEKRYQDALSLLQKAGADKPGADISWRRALAAAYMGTGRERDALPLLEQVRSEEHTSELQSLMRISYAVFCLKKKTTKQKTHDNRHRNSDRKQKK